MRVGKFMRSPAAEFPVNFEPAFHFLFARLMFRTYPPAPAIPARASVNTVPTDEFRCAREIADRSDAFAAQGKRPCAPLISNFSPPCGRCHPAENLRPAKEFPLRR